MTARRTGSTALALALLFCALAGWSYAHTRGDDSLAYAADRDRALADGTRRIAQLTGFDSGDPGLTRRRWLSAATGPLHDELNRSKPKSGPTARASVTAAALTALDARAGTAVMIATVRVTLKPGGSERKRLDATLARTPDGWKVEALSAVPVGSG
ncbi:hypothetical protein [Streptomyces katsurahamanus]|uniref:Mce-associated membrane protein n=1 Tax=Streptomyces katsurahamanus TaxID=2577098 RepID=A0ABW9NZI1_9ACTN|nr:hypothetical protein [Streptomyces katsurahamanus]MQS38732.1 hypothetical protein [Streptomyces katsurahamanus]